MNFHKQIAKSVNYLIDEQESRFQKKKKAEFYADIHCSTPTSTRYIKLNNGHKKNCNIINHKILILIVTASHK